MFVSIFKQYVFIFFILGFSTLVGAGNPDVLSLAKKLRCMVCQGQSIADSDSDFAHDVLHYIEDEKKQGVKNDIIINNLVDRYGEEILLMPSGYHVILWLVPYCILFVLLFLLCWSFYSP